MTYLRPWFFTIFLISTSLLANEAGTINYSGQESDKLSLETVSVETRYRTEQQDSTCTRQIPHTQNVCSIETLYRQVCNSVPGREICTIVNDNVCRSVRRTRRVCTGSTTREVCHNSSPRRTCRTARNGQRVCRDIPSRRVCRQVPGNRVCRSVPYYDRVCTINPRRVCHIGPRQNVCQQIPYQENVCRDVTTYTSENYACTRDVQVPYEVKKDVLAEINVNFTDSNNPSSLADLEFLLAPSGDVTLSLSDNSQVAPLIFINKEIIKESSESELKVQGLFDVKFAFKQEVLAPVLIPLDGVNLEKKSLSFLMGTVHNKAGNFKIKLKIERKQTLGGYKTLIDKELEYSDFTMDPQEGGVSLVNVNLEALEVKIKKKKHKVTLEVSLEVDEDVLNAPSQEELTQIKTFKISKK